VIVANDVDTWLMKNAVSQTPPVAAAL
jgi:hypothetical protein